MPLSLLCAAAAAKSGREGAPCAQQGGLSSLHPDPDILCRVHPGHGYGVSPALPPNCLTSADPFHVVYLLSLDMNFSTVGH